MSNYRAPAHAPVSIPYRINSKASKALTRSINQVRNFQRQLFEKGFLKGNRDKVIDGVWGPQTQKAWELAKKQVI